MTEMINRTLPVLRVPLKTIIDSSASVRINGVLNGRKIDCFSVDDIEIIRAGCKIIVYDDVITRSYVYKLQNLMAPIIHLASYHKVTRDPSLRLSAIHKYRTREEFWDRFSSDQTFSLYNPKYTKEEQSARHVLLAITWAATPTWARDEREYDREWADFKDQVPYDQQFVWTPEYFQQNA